MSDQDDIQQKTFTLPDGTSYTIGDRGAHLELTEERLKEAQENQKRWESLSASPFLGVTPQMAAYLRAVRELPVLLERLQILTDKLELPTPQLPEALRRVAECYATQGLYTEALTYASPEQRPVYKTMQHAIDRPDNDQCDPECGERFRASHALLTKETLHGYQFSPKHGEIMPVIRCAVCGSMNVKPMPETLARQMDARAKARDMTADMSHTQARETLERNGLTPEKVFNR